MSNGLVLNLGTPSPRKIQALLLAGQTAKEHGLPTVFDPVGVGCSDFRRQAAQEILTKVHPTVIRGNTSVILPLLADHVLREANHYIRLLRN